MSRRSTSTPSLTWGSDDCIAEAEVDFVRVETGGVVASRTHEQTCRGSFSEAIRWNGRDVPLGRYRVEADFRNDWGQTVASGSTTVTTASGEKTFRKLDQPRRDGLRLADEGRELQLGDAAGTRDPPTCAGGTARVVYRATAPCGFEIAAVRTYVHGGIIGCKADRWTKSISGMERRRDVDAQSRRANGRFQRDLDGILDHGLEDGPDLDSQNPRSIVTYGEESQWDRGRLIDNVKPGSMRRRLTSSRALNMRTLPRHKRTARRGRHTASASRSKAERATSNGGSASCRSSAGPPSRSARTWTEVASDPLIAICGDPSRRTISWSELSRVPPSAGGVGSISSRATRA